MTDILANMNLFTVFIILAVLCSIAAILYRPKLKKVLYIHEGEVERFMEYKTMQRIGKPKSSSKIKKSKSKEIRSSKLSRRIQRFRRKISRKLKLNSTRKNERIC